MDHSSPSDPSIFKRNLHILSFPIRVENKIKYALSVFIFLLIFSAVLFNLSTSFNPQSLFRLGILSRNLPSNQKTSSSEVCDYSYGTWVRDETYPLRSYTENCPFLDPGFRCRENGRKDDEYRKWRWQPNGCDLPRYHLSLLHWFCQGCFNITSLHSQAKYLKRVKQEQQMKLYGVAKQQREGTDRWQELIGLFPQETCTNRNKFNGTDLLERCRDGRIVFAGDSIGRNQWESLICMLAQAVSNKSAIYEEGGKPITKHKGFLSVRFQEYNLTVEYYRAPFLVGVGRPPQNSSLQVRTTVKVDQLHWFAEKWVGADVLIFNAGHWWNEDKTVKMNCYFQEGGKVNMSMNVMEAFRRSLQTVKSWVLNNLDPERSHTFFRSYSPVHYRNGTWNKGGFCGIEREPETNYTQLEADPANNKFISDVIKRMRDENRKVQFLNITYLTEFRKDGHPSLHREPGTPPDAPQDCSHWCLPGLPDTWNELLYAYLLSMAFRIN